MGYASTSCLKRLRSAWDLNLRAAPEDRPRQHVYTAVGAGVGVLSIVSNVLISGKPPIIDLTFMIMALALLSFIPLLPFPFSITYLICWMVLIFMPDAYATDMIITNFGFFVLLGRFLPRWPAITLAFGINVTVVIAMLTQPTGLHPNNIEAAVVILFMTLLLVPMGMLLRTTERARLAESKHAKERLNAMRLEIAREMHDLVAYSMSQTALRAQRAAADAAYPPEARREFTALECTAADALHELRLLLRTLRQEDLDPKESVDTATGLGHIVTDLTTAIQAVSDDVSAAGFNVTCRRVGEAIPTRAQASTLSRVAREMGANIIRHGDIDWNVTLTLTLGPELIRLVATNKIHEGSPRLPRSGSGILGMRERLNAIGGTLTTLSEAGSWMVVASVPCATTTHTSPQPLEKVS